MERGRPRTRRIIARVILPRLCRLSFSFLYLSALPSAVLSASRACVRTYTRVSICMQEKLGEREESRPRARAERGGQARGGRAWKRLRRRSEVSRTLDEADATPTERHPRENPSPRSPRLLLLLLLHLLPSSPPLLFFSPRCPPSLPPPPRPSPNARASFALPPLRSAPALRGCVSRRVFEPDCTLHIPAPNSWHINRDISACFAFVSNNRIFPFPPPRTERSVVQVNRNKNENCIIRYVTIEKVVFDY